MGKKSKAQDLEMRRQFQEKRRQEEEAKRRAQNRLMWQIIAGTLAVILLAVGIPMGVRACRESQAIRFGEIEGYQNASAITEYVRMDITYTNSAGQKVGGSIVIHLDSATAPRTVENFQTLVFEKFYDGLTFHRVYKGFMIQGGDPDGNGGGGAPNKIVGEFSANGIENNLKHTRGVISMARSQSYNSASSQFFIMHQTSAQLDGQYAAFGKVSYGMDTVDGIAGTPVTYGSGVDSVPTTPVNPVTIVAAYFVSPTN